MFSHKQTVSTLCIVFIDITSNYTNKRTTDVIVNQPAVFSTVCLQILYKRYPATGETFRQPVWYTSDKCYPLTSY